jgi:hypothetical protein
MLDPSAAKSGKPRPALLKYELRIRKNHHPTKKNKFPKSAKQSTNNNPTNNFHTGRSRNNKRKVNRLHSIRWRLLANRRVQVSPDSSLLVLWHRSHVREAAATRT